MFNKVDFDKIQSLIAKLENNIASVVMGKRDVIRQCLVAFFSGEHLLLEDVPGVGKTLLGQALAKSLSASFKRIQFTPDLIPADITGGNIYNQKTQEFGFFQGPIFSNIILADEINRTTPRTQSAMLEAMSEHQVSCDGITYQLPQPFMVIATENPIEFEGTYPLPESQMDRFLMRISIGYPERADELAILKAHQESVPIDHLEPVLDVEQVRWIQSMVRKVDINDHIMNYVLNILETTRECSELFVGVSTRGGILFCRAAQAHALTSGRDYVIPDDIKKLAVPVLAHRVITKNSGQKNERDSVEALIERLLNTVPVPA